jgi:hypothetical protein
MRRAPKSRHARLSAFHHGACCGERTPQLSSSDALPGTCSDARPPMLRTTWFERPCASQRHDPRRSRVTSGRYPLRPVPVQRVSPQTGHPAGRAYSPEPPGSKGDEPLPAGTVSLRPPASPAGVLYESEILWRVTERRTKVKEIRHWTGNIFSTTRPWTGNLVAHHRLPARFSGGILRHTPPL